MKIPKNKIALLVSILAVSALAVFCGILVMTSDSFTPNTKYSFTVLLLAIETAVIAVLFALQEQLTQRKDDAAARKEIADQEKAVAEKETELKDKTKAVAAREEKLKEQQEEFVELKQKVLAAARKEDAPSELEQLRRKCETLEKFRSSFPYTIAEGYVLFGVMRTELKVSSFSRWLLVGEIGGQLWAYSLLRPDTQSHKEMLCLAAGTHAPKELEELDLSKQLLWE
ncbi:MAG: hypothetical protein ACLSS9_00260 [Acutalibacteraceae bacterium]